MQGTPFFSNLGRYEEIVAIIMKNWDDVPHLQLIVNGILKFNRKRQIYGVDGNAKFILSEIRAGRSETTPTNALTQSKQHREYTLLLNVHRF